MTDPSQETLEEIRASIAALEQRIYSLEYHWHENQKPTTTQPTVTATAAAAPAAATPPVAAPQSPPPYLPSKPVQTVVEPAKTITIEDLLSPRRLAWLGGAVLVAGIAFLVSIGIQDGWITPTMQLVAALIVCLGLSWGGFWLYEQRDQGPAAMAMYGTGIAGFYATLFVASQEYDFVDPLWLGLLFAAIVATAGTVVALRWDSQPMAALALLGAVSSPLLLGMSDDGGAVFYLLVAYAAIAIVCALQDWRALAVSAVFFMLASATWSLGELGTVAVISTTLTFWMLTVVSLYGSTVLELRQPSSEGEFDWSAAIVFTGVTSLIALLIGVWISDDWPLWETTQPDQQVAVWLIGFAALNFLLALGSRAAGERMREIEFNALMVGFVLFTVGLGYAFSGPTLVIAFAVEAIVVAVRFRDTEQLWARWAPAPLVALCVLHVLDQEVPIELLETSAGKIASIQLQNGVAAIVATVAAALSWAWFTRDEARAAAVLVAEAGVIYLMLLLLDGIGLVTALCALTAATAYVGRERGRLFSLVVPSLALSTALLHVIVHEASLESALSTGVDDPLIAGLALLMIAAVAGFWASLVEERDVRMTLTGIGLISLVFAGSVEIVSAFQPSAADFATGGSEFGARQQGQALLSGFWAIAALAAIVYGLLNSVKEIRYAGLVLLAIAVGKIVLFDLTSLDAAYRTGSFIAVGAMLLLAAFAYQNVKERVIAEPEPDPIEQQG